MRIGHVAGPLFTIACLVGLYLAWPYVRGWLGGTWLANLDLIVLPVVAVLALSGLHALEVRVAARFAGRTEDSSDH